MFRTVLFTFALHRFKKKTESEGKKTFEYHITIDPEKTEEIAKFLSQKGLFVALNPQVAVMGNYIAFKVTLDFEKDFSGDRDKMGKDFSELFGPCPHVSVVQISKQDIAYSNPGTPEVMALSILNKLIDDKTLDLFKTPVDLTRYIVNCFGNVFGGIPVEFTLSKGSRRELGPEDLQALDLKDLDKNFSFECKGGFFAMTETQWSALGCLKKLEQRAATRKRRSSEKMSATPLPSSMEIEAIIYEFFLAKNPECIIRALMPSVAFFIDVVSTRKDLHLKEQRSYKNNVFERIYSSLRVTPNPACSFLTKAQVLCVMEKLSQSMPHMGIPLKASRLSIIKV